VTTFRQQMIELIYDLEQINEGRQVPNYQVSITKTLLEALDKEIPTEPREFDEGISRPTPTVLAPWNELFNESQADNT